MEYLRQSEEENMEYTFTVNGIQRRTGENKPLLRYLRDDLHLYSAKDGCSEGACGTCTVLVNGRAVKACVLTTALAAGKNIITVEGLSLREKEGPDRPEPGPYGGRGKNGDPRQCMPVHRLQEDY